MQDIPTDRIKVTTTHEKIRLYNLVILIIGFTDGLVYAFELVFNLMNKDTYSASPAQSQLFDVFRSIPWILKPFWGNLSDNRRIFGYRRKSYIFLTSLISMTSFFLYGVFSVPIFFAVIFAFVINFAASFQNCIGEALIVENTTQINHVYENDEKEKQKVASTQVSRFLTSRYCGKIIAYLTATVFLTSDNVKVFLVNGTFIQLGVLFAAIILPEIRRISNRNGLLSWFYSRSEPPLENNTNRDETEKQNSSLMNAIQFMKTPLISKSILFFFVAGVVPSISTANFYYFTNVLNFTPSFLAVLGLVGYIAIIAGVHIYNHYYRATNFRRYFMIVSLISCTMHLSQLMLYTGFSSEIGIPNKVFCVIDKFANDLVYELRFFPVFILAARICPKNLEGTVFAIIISCSNLAVILSNTLGAILLEILNITENNFSNINLLVIISGSFYFFPFLLLSKIRFEDTIKVNDAEKITNEKERSNTDPLDQSLEIELATYKRVQPTGRIEDKSYTFSQQCHSSHPQLSTSI